MSAHWHVRIEDRARLLGELSALDMRLSKLDAHLRDAVARARHSPCPDTAAATAEDMKRLVAEMDLLMTRSRAVEGKLRVLQEMSSLRFFE